MSRLNEENRMRQKAWEHHEKGQYHEAEILYKKLIESDVKEYDVSNLGALMRNLGRAKEAFLLYKRWTKVFSKSINVLLNATNCAIETDNIVEARKWIDNGLAENPNNIELIKANARVMQLEGRDIDAITILERAKLLPENDINILLELGKIYDKNEDYDRALINFKMAYKLDQIDSRSAANIITILEKNDPISP